MLLIYKRNESLHHSGVIIGEMASQIAGVSIVFSTVCSGADQRKHQSSASLTFVRGIHRWSVNSPHKGPVTRKMFHLITSSWSSTRRLHLPVPSQIWKTIKDAIMSFFISRNKFSTKRVNLIRLSLLTAWGGYEIFNGMRGLAIKFSIYIWCILISTY